MPAAAVTVQGLGKRYQLGDRGHYGRISEAVFRLAGAPTRLLRSHGQAEQGPKYVWALRDVSFEVEAGEVVGIIGRNGAGKSTLLKILSRITEPTEGRADMRGRVGSLLEVGTGFHPELTGRENIYLNGAILGMTRARDRAASSTRSSTSPRSSEFLDTPVKRYSSGMYVRLGVRRGRAPGAGDPDRRRGAGGRRRRRSRRSASARWRTSPARAAPCCSSATTCKQ